MEYKERILNLFSKKAPKDLLQSGEKKEVISEEDKAEKIKKTKLASSAKTAGKNNRKNAILEKFEDLTKIPSNAVIVSDVEGHPYELQDKTLKDDLLILEANYAPNGGSKKKNCIIAIFNNSKFQKMNIQKIKTQALEEGKTFVYCRKDSGLFIVEVKKSLKMNKGQAVVESKGNRKRVVDLFKAAYAAGASDLHIEVGSEITRLRIRVNGIIREFVENKEGAIIGKDSGMTIARTIYNSFSVVSGMSLNEKITQDASGSIPNINGEALKIRIATAPTDPKGVTMVIRLLAGIEPGVVLTLDQLGYAEKQKQMIKEALAQGTGVTIIAGTTGSGKSTTLQNVLQAEINNRNGNIKVITVEDPPEYLIVGADQIPISRDKDGDAKKLFKNAIKASLRMDPDIIMIGEVRDEQSAELLVEAVQTGHKVLSTLHAGSALSIIGRLSNLGISNDVLADNEFISGLIYQKLFPVLCTHCSLSLKDGYIPVKKDMETIVIEELHMEDRKIRAIIKTAKEIGVNVVRHLQDCGHININEAQKINRRYEAENNKDDNEEFLKRISSVAGNIDEHNIRFQGSGCKYCKSGIKGRTVVSEVVRPDMGMRELISKGNSIEIYKYWRKNMGGKLAVEDAYNKMMQGLLSPVDIEDTFGFISPKDV